MTARNTLISIAVTSVIAVAVIPAASAAAVTDAAKAPTTGSHPFKSHKPTVIHIIEHAVTDTVQQFHPPADSVGDVLGFRNPMYDQADAKVVGTDNGFCIRTVATGQKAWECSITTLLSKGNLTVQGQFFDDGTDTTLTVTGGTGAYVGAKGSMLLHATGTPVGSEYDFVFTLADH